VARTARPGGHFSRAASGPRDPFLETLARTESRAALLVERENKPTGNTARLSFT